MVLEGRAGPEWLRECFRVNPQPIDDGPLHGSPEVVWPVLADPISALPHAELTVPTPLGLHEENPGLLTCLARVSSPSDRFMLFSKPLQGVKHFLGV